MTDVALAAGPGITLAKEAATHVLRVSAASSGRLAYGTWAELSAVDPGVDGTAAEVPIDDAGTHTDPVVGGTVDNSGAYRWSVSPAGWERIADVDALSASPFADAAADSATDAATSATASATSAAAIPNYLSRRSIWPDPWFETTGGTDTVKSGGAFLYSQGGTGGSSQDNRTWDATYKHEYGIGAWKYDSAAAHTLMGFNVAWAHAAAAEVNIVAGDKISMGWLVVGSGGTVSCEGRFYTAVSATGAYTFGANSPVAGSTGIAMDGTVKVLKLENQTVPSGAIGNAPHLFDGTASDFRVLAFWVVKDTVAGDRPPVRSSHEQLTRRLASDYAPFGTSAKADYSVNAVDSLAATATATAVHSAASITHGTHTASPFGGFAQAFSSSGITAFNGLRVRGLFRAANPTALWSSILFEVRTHATDAHSASPIATATIRIDPSLQTITQIDAPLKDPATGAYLTTAQVTALLLADVMVSYRALDANGNTAFVGDLQGAVTGLTLRHAYYWNANSLVFALTDATVPTIAIELISVTSPALTTSYKPTPALKTDLGLAASSALPFFTIPANINAVVGTELNLYYDAIFSAHSMGLDGLAGYSVSIVGTKGKNGERQFRFTPVTADIGTTSFTASAWDDAGNLVATRAFTITVVAATAKASAKNVLMVGDSLTAANFITQTVRDDFVALGATIPTFSGTQGTGSNKHEGYGGRKFYDFVTAGTITYEFTVSGVTTVTTGATYTTGGVTYTVVGSNITAGSGTIQTTGASAPGASGTLTRASGAGDATIAFSASTTIPANKFWNPGTTTVDIAYFRSQNSIASVFDGVTIQLGINDVKGESTADIPSIIDNAKTLCTAFLADNASCKIILILPTICCNTNDGFAATTGATNSRQVFEANIFALRAAMITAFDAGAFNANVKVGAAGLQMDRYFGYPQTTAAAAGRIANTVTTLTNNYHPQQQGYQQIGDAIYGSLMAAL